MLPLIPDFTYSKDQVVSLAGWYRANAELGHGFSTALEFALFPADKDEAAIWPNATLKTVPFIARLLEDIERVSRGESKFRWHSVPRKTNYPNEPHYISYTMENWMREGLKMELDPTLDEPVKFKPDFTLTLPEDDEKAS